jgi:hypothetical protein
VSKGHCAAFQVLHLAPGKIFPRLERCDVEFDLPETFLPEFPPAMFLQNRPELGDVSRGFSFLNAPKLGELAVRRLVGVLKARIGLYRAAPLARIRRNGRRRKCATASECRRQSSAGRMG